MDNLFSTITKGLPPPSKAHQEELAKLDGTSSANATALPALQDRPLKDVVLEWQKKETPEGSAVILTKLQPTIRSAITSYAPGMEKSLAIKAAGLALDAMRTYKPDQGTDPTTFAFHNLKRLSRLGATRGVIMPQAESARYAMQTVVEASRNFEDQRGREPSMAELADITGLSKTRVTKLLDAPIATSDSSTLSEDSQETTHTSKDVGPDDYYEYVYRSVGPIDQKIMEWASGKRGKTPLSTSEIATKLKISAAAVSQRKAKIHRLMSDVQGVL